MDNMLLGSLIQFAYEGEADELRGLPLWAQRERYNVGAAASGSERADVAAAMRVFLREHLGFRAHLDAVREDVLTLMRILPDRPLIGLRKVDIDCAAPTSGATGTSMASAGVVPPCVTHSGRVVASGGESMARFAGFVSAILGSKVVDKTGLEGYYAYTLKYSPDFPGAEPPTPEYPRIRAALRQQLGLMVKRRTVVTRVLVVDRLERPSTN